MRYYYDHGEEGLDSFVDLLNRRLCGDGLALMGQLSAGSIATCFFDPQYRGILDRQMYGNEGRSREKRRCDLQQMDVKTIVQFTQAIERVLRPSGHLFFWIDKFSLCEGAQIYFDGVDLKIVDLIVWEKNRIGMGYRSRNKCEFLLVLQKKPIRSKGCWHCHNIPNVWKEGVDVKMHPHAKPIQLQKCLIEATTCVGDVVLDPAMGSGSVLQACGEASRDFIGTDIGLFSS